jgi:hypothetical protein
MEGRRRWGGSCTATLALPVRQCNCRTNGDAEPETMEIARGSQR